MKQGRMWMRIALVALFATTALTAVRVDAAPRKPATASTSKRAGVALHQFSGVVTDLDKSSLTVAKSGKSPRTMTFSKHPEMRTTGDLEKDARVTVWYRDEAGHAVAHKVVVKV
jgi:hypothetical protein